MENSTQTHESPCSICGLLRCSHPCIDIEQSRLKNDILEMCAQMIENHISSNCKEYHLSTNRIDKIRFCEDYGCYGLEDLAEKIRDLKDNV